MDVLHVYDINKILFDNVWVRGLLFWTGINKEQEVRDIFSVNPSRLRSFKAEQLLWHFGGIQQRPDDDPKNPKISMEGCAGKSHFQRIQEFLLCGRGFCCLLEMPVGMALLGLTGILVKGQV